MSVEFNELTKEFELKCDECGVVIESGVAADADPDQLCEDCTEVDEEEAIEDIETPSDADPGL